ASPSAQVSALKPASRSPFARNAAVFFSSSMIMIRTNPFISQKGRLRGSGLFGKTSGDVDLTGTPCRIGERPAGGRVSREDCVRGVWLRCLVHWRVLRSVPNRHGSELQRHDQSSAHGFSDEGKSDDARAGIIEVVGRGPALPTNPGIAQRPR